MRTSGYGSTGDAASTAAGRSARARVAGAGQAAGWAGSGSAGRAWPRLPKITSTVPPASSTSPRAMQTDEGRQQPVDLDAQPRVEVDTPTGVGVHQHHRPVAALDLPGQLVGLVGRHLGDPERLVPGRLGCRLPGTRRYRTRSGDSSKSRITSWLTPSRYAATSALGPIPAKTVCRIDPDRSSTGPNRAPPGR